MYYIDESPHKDRRTSVYLTVELLNGNDVVPAGHEAAAQLPVVGGHESVADGGVLQSQGVADLMSRHHEQVVALVSVEGPPLCAVKVGLASPRQEGVSQGSS